MGVTRHGWLLTSADFLYTQSRQNLLQGCDDCVETKSLTDRAVNDRLTRVRPEHGLG